MSVLEEKVLKKLARFCIAKGLTRPEQDRVVYVNALAHRFVAFPEGLGLLHENEVQEAAVGAVAKALVSDELWELVARGVEPEEAVDASSEAAAPAPPQETAHMKPKVPPETVPLPPGVDAALAHAARAAFEALECRPGFVPPFHEAVKQVAGGAGTKVMDNLMAYLREVYQGIPQAAPVPVHPPPRHYHPPVVHRHERRRERHDHTEIVPARSRSADARDDPPKPAERTPPWTGILVAALALTLLVLAFLLLWSRHQ